MAKDLVCGMTVDPKTAAATSEFQGVNYYFCCSACKSAFDKNPVSYISNAGQSKQ